jgi:hypothetical protein
LCVVQTEDISITRCMCDTYTWQSPSIFIRGKPTFWSERLLQKDYDRKGSVEKKKSLVVNLKGLGASRKVTLTVITRES